jgi:hypothetical protein
MKKVRSRLWGSASGIAQDTSEASRVALIRMALWCGAVEDQEIRVWRFLNSPAAIAAG